MDQSPPPEDAAESTHEERPVGVPHRMTEAVEVLAETLLGRWRSKHRAELRGQAWPPPEEPKPEPPRRTALTDKPLGPPRRIFRDSRPGMSWS